MSNRLVLIIYLLFGFMPTSFANQDKPEDAINMVNQMVAFYDKEVKATGSKAEAKKKLLAEISTKNGLFHKGELYGFAYDLKATNIAHPVNPKIIGVNLHDAPDSDGKYFRREIVEKALRDGKGWTDYKYKKPDVIDEKTKAVLVKGAVEPKTTYYVLIDDFIVACGIYKN